MRKSEERNTQIIVLSRNYSTGLGVIRSLGMAGYQLDLIASVKKSGSSKICSSSKYVNRAVEVKAPDIRTDDGDRIVMELLKYPYKSEKIILFPADDYTTSIIDNYRHVLSDRFIMPYSEAYSLSYLMNKKIQIKLAQSAGLNVPKDWHVDLRREINLPLDIEFPIFVKPTDSVSGHKDEMKVVKSKQELMQHLLKMQSTYINRSVILQEYLEIEKEYDFSGLSTGEEIIIPGILEKTRIASYERGVTMAGKMHAVEKIPEFEEDIVKIKDLISSFKYHGMFDMEMNLVNGKLYFGEINLRSGGPNFAYTLSGANLPDAMVKSFRGEKFKEPLVKGFENTYVYEKVAWEDYIHGYMSKEDMQIIIEDADFTLLDNSNDPAPGKNFYYRIRLSALKNKMMFWKSKR